MDQQSILEAVRAFVKREFSGEGTGHDFFHLERVVNIAIRIAREEKADLFLTELAAWLHDVGDHKLNNGVDKSEEQITAILRELHTPDNVILNIITIVSQVSFSKGKKAESIEAKIVQDADRLDAIGAIGLARVFAYGGSKQREIYNPEQPEQTSIQHFYDKLLKLKDLMQTQSGRQIALERHVYLESFLKRFYEEWDGNA